MWPYLLAPNALGSLIVSKLDTVRHHSLTNGDIRLRKKPSLQKNSKALVISIYNVWEKYVGGDYENASPEK